MLSVIMLNVTMLSDIMLSVIMMIVIMPSVIMLSVIMLNVIMLSVVMLSVTMLSVVASSVTKEKKCFIKFRRGAKLPAVKVRQTGNGSENGSCDAGNFRRRAEAEAEVHHRHKIQRLPGANVIKLFTAVSCDFSE